MAFTVQLVSLRCVTAQENDGDEIYINVDGRTLWSVGGLRMHQGLSDPQQVDEVDFVHGRLHGPDGWAAMQSFEAEHYRVTVNDERTQLRLMERDLLIGDDVLGEAFITASDAASNRITLAFTAQGAHYMLSYSVTA